MLSHDFARKSEDLPMMHETYTSLDAISPSREGVPGITPFELFVGHVPQPLPQGA